MQNRVQEAFSDLMTSNAPARVVRALVESPVHPRAPRLAIDGIPVTLLDRRPDVQRARSLWRAAENDLEVAAAERYPRLDITAGLGLLAGSVSALATNSAVFSTLGPGLAWNVLDFGRLRAEIDQAAGRSQEALASYKQAMLSALVESQQALADLQWRHSAEESARFAVEAQQQAWELAMLQYRQGLVDFGTVLDTQRELNRLRDVGAQYEQASWLAIARAFSVLGGGWGT